MHMTRADAQSLVTELVETLGRETAVRTLVCPPFTALSDVGKILENSNIALGAQNMHAEPSGAFTGEVSAAMLRDLFVTHVIIGHSERRSLFGETDRQVNNKVQAALKSSLKPIMCVGESLQEREADQTLAVIERQMSVGLAKVAKSKAEQLIIAYEPIWAIGTGRAATPAMAQEVHAAIRALLAKQFGDEKAAQIRILYGGSVKPTNAKELFEQEDIDGALVGGASLQAASFIKIAQAAYAMM
tara:strand:+ start:3228 stop:3959 length:732 start_codon:yes stop_codon:yes gene_type:complete